MLPITDPFERVLQAPKESLVQRSGSPRSATPSPHPSADNGLVFEQLPSLDEAMAPVLREKVLEGKLAQCAILFAFQEAQTADTDIDADLDNGNGSGSGSGSGNSNPGGNSNLGGNNLGGNNPGGSSAHSSIDAVNQATNRRTSAANITVSAQELRNREIKRQNLLELIEALSRTNSAARTISDNLYASFFAMVFANLFRPLAPPVNPCGDAFDPTEDEPVLEPTWPHLRLVYELLIRFLETPDLNVALARRWVDQSFVLQLLALFDVEDPRERDLLKTTLHRVYAKFLQLRAFIRRAIHNVFYDVVAGTDANARHNIAEMLEILGSIINGFALPLKDEHKLFLERTLLPLHKTRFLPLYFRQLDYCVVQFIEKDGSLAGTVVKALLRMWPRTNSTKEVMFLGELEEILDLAPPNEFAAIAVPLFRRLALCIDSDHFQVAERALLLWNNEYLLGLMSQQVHAILPLLLPVLSKHSRGHWNRNVQLLALAALESFMHMDAAWFDECVGRLAESRRLSSRAKMRHVACWQQLERLALRHSDCDDPLELEQRRSLLEKERRAQVQVWALLHAEGGIKATDPDNGNGNGNGSVSGSGSGNGSSCGGSSMAVSSPGASTPSVGNVTLSSSPSASSNPSSWHDVPSVQSSASSSFTTIRRKSVLPMDAELATELVRYSASRTPSPAPDPLREDTKKQ
jgi:hypothetical protein